MTKPTLWQCIFGVKDLTSFRLSDDEAVVIARDHAERIGEPITENCQDEEVMVAGGIHRKRFAWFLQFPAVLELPEGDRFTLWKGPATLVTIDDESGEVVEFGTRHY